MQCHRPSKQLLSLQSIAMLHNQKRMPIWMTFRTVTAKSWLQYRRRDRCRCQWVHLDLLIWEEGPQKQVMRPNLTDSENCRWSIQSGWKGTESGVFGINELQKKLKICFLLTDLHYRLWLLLQKLPKSTTSISWEMFFLTKNWWLMLDCTVLNIKSSSFKL